MTQLKVGTYNVAGGLHPDTLAINRLIRAKSLNIVGLQEIDQATQRNPYLMDKAIAQGDYQSYFSKAIAFENGAYGIATLTDHPTKQDQTTYYQQFKSERRVYSRVSYPIAPDKSLAVYNTHLSFEDQATRHAQMLALNAAITADPCPNRLLLGDFNTDQSLAEWQFLTQNFNVANGQAGHWYETFNGRDEQMKVYTIDNILTSRNIQISAVTMSPQILSDHQLLSATITF